MHSGFANNTEPIIIREDSMIENIKWFLDGSINIMSFVILYENDDLIIFFIMLWYISIYEG
jgi:hypothetical protein